LLEQHGGIEDQSPGSRIVVFVDDLDRCNPTKASEVPLEPYLSLYNLQPEHRLTPVLSPLQLMLILALSEDVQDQNLTARNQQCEMRKLQDIREKVVVSENLTEYDVYTYA
jgi:hypothetical protein